MPKSELSAARELINVFKADHMRGTKSRKRQLKQDQPAEEQQDAHGEDERKKRRGRPRKQS